MSAPLLIVSIAEMTAKRAQYYMKWAKQEFLEPVKYGRVHIRTHPCECRPKRASTKQRRARSDTNLNDKSIGMLHRLTFVAQEEQSRAVDGHTVAVLSRHHLMSAQSAGQHFD